MLLRLLSLATLLLLSACAGLPEPAGGASRPLAITNVTIIDLDAPAATAAVANRTVLIQGGVIQSVGPAAAANLPRGAKVIDGTGRFLIPGLWDFHSHLTSFGDSVLPLLVSQGVTSVRDVGGIAADLKNWRDAVVAGRQVGPRIFLPGRSSKMQSG